MSSMGAASQFAAVLIDELVRGGVTEAVLAPGSRNAPLSFALHDADRTGRLRLHVRIDERTAGFLALGLAKGSGRPVPVITTSGTATANLHPAVLEADAAGTPLLVLTADRPPELRGRGANQTVNQIQLYGDAVRLFAEVGVPEDRPGQNAHWRSTASRALVVATGALSGDPGPVHLNLALREPLVPDPQGLPASLPADLAGRSNGGPWTRAKAGPRRSVPPYDGVPRTLVIVGDCSNRLALAAVALAADRGWPLIAEPVTSAAACGLPAGPLLLADPGLLARAHPERVLVVGRPTLSRAVGALLRSPEVEVDVVPSGPRWADASGVAARVLDADVLEDSALGAARDRGFLHAWLDAAGAAGGAVQAFLDGEPGLTGLHAARAVSRTLTGRHTAADGEPLLVVGSSSGVRDLDVVGRLPPVQVVANRGVAGIDGMVSTAVGAALATQRSGGGPAYALLGDLTFLHDATALMIGPGEPRPDLTLVVVNDDGGGIFTRLEPGAAEHAAAFERIFGTPTGVDLAALCAASGTAHRRVGEADLRAALLPQPGLRVVEVPVERGRTRELHERLLAAVRSATAG